MAVQYCSIDTSEQINELDLTLLAELFKAVGWGKYTNLDRSLFLQWAGELTVAVKLEGRLIACGMAVKYNGDCARLCCIITHPDFQGKGLARQVTQKLLNILHEKGIQCVELDASDQGKTLYEKLGFRSIGNVHCYHLNHTEKPESKNCTVLANHPGQSIEVHTIASNPMVKEIVLSMNFVHRTNLTRMVLEEGRARKENNNAYFAHMSPVVG